MTCERVAVWGDGLPLVTAAPVPAGRTGGGRSGRDGTEQAGQRALGRSADTGCRGYWGYRGFLLPSPAQLLLLLTVGTAQG